MLCKTQKNPQTNRCVLKTGKIGSRIIGRPKLCDTVLNTETKRCILRENRVSETRSRKKVKMKISKQKVDCLYVPRRYAELAEKCACNDRWMKKTKIGSGAFGKVYQACRFQGQNLVVKVQQNDQFAKAEFKAYKALQNKHILPKLLAVWVCKGKMYMVLEQLYDCVQPVGILMKRLDTKVQKLFELGWLHCDLHWGNVMCKKNNRVVLIDFGLSVQKGKGPYENQPNYTFGELRKLQTEQFDELKLERLSKSS